MNTPRKHHSVPQSLLREFGILPERRNIHVYDKSTRRIFPSPIVDAAAERDFYTVEVDTGSVNFEPVFQDLDDRLATLLRQLCLDPDLSRVMPQLKSEASALVATQLMRTKLQRTSPGDIAAQLNAIAAANDIDVQEVPPPSNPTLMHLRALLMIPEIAAILEEKDLIRFQSTSDAEFWLSDNPVVMENSYPYGRVGLKAPGIGIYLPISPRDCLAFLCPSICKQIRESLDPSHPRPKTKSEMLACFPAAAASGEKVIVDAGFVRSMNTFQVAQSSRFLYNRDGDFALANEILSVDESLSNVQSTITIGELGTIAPLRGPMPPGDFLVVESGYNHHVLHIVDVSPEGEPGITFTTSDSAKLEQIQADSPFDSIMLVHDGSPHTMMRGAVIVEVYVEGRSVLRVQHADDSLNRLMRAISDRRDVT